MNNSLTCLITLFTVLPSVLLAETVTKRVDLEDIKHIHVVGPYQLKISQGEEEFIALTTDSDYIDAIEVKVQGSKLVIGESDMHVDAQFNFNVRVGDSKEEVRHAALFEMQVKELRSISNLGVGRVEVFNINNGDDLSFSNLGAGRFILESVLADNIELNNLGAGRIVISDLEADDIEENSTGAGTVEYFNVRTDDFEINSTGSASTKISGNSEADHLDIALNGGGEVDAEALKADEVEVSIRGAGIARVYAEDNLDVNIEGPGSVYYRGSPDIKQSLGKAGELISIGQ